MRLLQQLLCRKEKHHDEDSKPNMDDKAPHTDVISTEPSSGLNLEHLLHTLTRRLKVQQAAILDHHGNVLCVTSDWKLGPDEGFSLQRTMSAAPTRGMWRLSLFGHDFRCFHCDEDRTVLGHSTTTVMTAHKTRQYIVVGLAPENVPGSCLHEMMLVWSQIESRGL